MEVFNSPDYTLSNYSDAYRVYHDKFCNTFETLATEAYGNNFDADTFRDQFLTEFMWSNDINYGWVPAREDHREFYRQVVTDHEPVWNTYHDLDTLDGLHLEAMAILSLEFSNQPFHYCECCRKVSFDWNTWYHPIEHGEQGPSLCGGCSANDIQS